MTPSRKGQRIALNPLAVQREQLDYGFGVIA